MSPAAVSKPASPGAARTAIANTKNAWANVRTGPGTDYDDIGDIRDNSLVAYYPDTRRDGEWLWVEQRGLKGWVFGGVVQFEDAVANVPASGQPSTPYDGKVGLWHWKGQGVPENTVTELATNIKRHAPNVNQVWVKTSDGGIWQGQWDSSAMAVDGPQSIDKWVADLVPHGLEFHAWCVLKGEDIDAEAARIIEVCQRPGVKSMILDVEPYVGYWRAGRDPIRPLMTKVRRVIPSEFHIGLSVDPRPWHYDKIFPAEWLPFVNSVHPQCYWHTFGQSAEDVLQQTYQTWGSYGRPIIPVLDGDAPLLEQQTAHTLATRRHGAIGLSWWRYGGISQWAAVNTPVVIDSGGSESDESTPTDNFADERVIVPGGDGFRSGTYTGRQEFQKFRGTWDWDVLYKATVSQGSQVWAEWKTNLSKSGTYQISTFVPTRHATTNRARFKIHGIKGTDTEVIVEIDQGRHRNQWVSLGIFDLVKGAPNAGKVFLNDVTGESGKEIAFDAIRWRRIVTTSPTTPLPDTGTSPPVTVVNGVYVADGYDAPIGTDEERRGTRVWPKGWLDASPFGRLYFQGTWREAYHTGADLNWGSPYADKGLPTYACANGVVVFAGNIRVWGNVIVIRHDPLGNPGGKVLYSRYGHVQNVMVKVGDRVKRGRQVAEVGDAFGTLVPHLHFDLSPTAILETKPQDWPGKDQARLLKNYIDPLIWIQNNRP